MQVHASQQIELEFPDRSVVEVPRVRAPPGPGALIFPPMTDGDAWGVMVISEDEDVTEEFNQLACIAMDDGRMHSDDELAQAVDESLNDEFELLRAIAESD